MMCLNYMHSDLLQPSQVSGLFFWLQLNGLEVAYQSAQIFVASYFTAASST